MSRGRSRFSTRYRRAAKTSMTSVAVRAFGLITSLISIRLLLNHLGEERFGIWVTLSSLVAFLNFADLGLGNGLLNNLTEANAKSDRARARKDVSTAFFMLGGIAGGLALVLAAAHPLVDWGDLFQAQVPGSRLEVEAAVLILGVLLLVSIPLGVGEKIELAHQTGFRYNGALAVSIAIAFTTIVVGSAAGAGLPLFVAAAAAPPALAGALSCLHNFFRARPWLRPSIRKLDPESARLIAGTGVLFLALQVSVSVAYSIDNLVITRVLGAASVPKYAIPFRLFNTVHLLISLMMAPLWPAYRDAFLGREHAWIKRTLRRSLYVSAAVSSSLALLLVIWGRPILHLWLGRDIEPSGNLLIGLGCWTVLAGAGSAIAMFLNGTGILRIQVILSLSMSLANLGLSIFLTGRIGVEGAVWSTVISYTLFVMIPLIFYLPKILKRLDDSESTRSAV